MKTNIFQYLSQISSIVTQLSKRKEIVLITPKKRQFFFENIFISKTTLLNLQMIKEQLKRELENQSNEQSEKELLKQEIHNLNAKIDKIQFVNIQISSEIESIKKEAKGNFNPLDIEIEKKLINEECYNQDITFIKEIILMRDNLSMRKEMLNSSAEPKDSFAFKLIQLSNKETEGILKRMGVFVINQKGSFNSDLQMVVNTKPTDDTVLHDTIAETFRDGYCISNKIIRLQEVILYSYNQEV